VERNVAIMDADSSIGILSCIIAGKDGKIWSSGGRYKAGFPVNLQDDFQGIRSVDYVAGTACFFRREVFDKIGFPQEHYFAYHEDVEFGLRLRAETVYQACMFAEKLVVHYLEMTMPRSEVYYLGSRNHILLLKKYNPRYLPKVLLWYTREITRFLVRSISKPSLRFLLVKPRPWKFSVFVKMKLLCLLWTLNMALGILAGLVNRQSK